MRDLFWYDYLFIFLAVAFWFSPLPDFISVHYILKKKNEKNDDKEKD